MNQGLVMINDSGESFCEAGVEASDCWTPPPLSLIPSRAYSSKNEYSSVLKTCMDYSSFANLIYFLKLCQLGLKTSLKSLEIAEHLLAVNSRHQTYCKLM